MSDLTLTIPGEPMGKGRPRWAKWGAYTDKKTVNYETQIRERFSSEYPNFIPLEGSLRLEVWAFHTIPKSKSKKIAFSMEMGRIRPAKRPDADNILKICLDALQTLAYKNDSQVVEIEIHKWYSKMPRLEISIIKEI